MSMAASTRSVGGSDTVRPYPACRRPGAFRAGRRPGTTVAAVARQDRKKKGDTGRTTPKGGSGSGARHAISKGHAAGEVRETGSGRYTAPIPQEFKVSPMWVPVLMFTLLGLGALVIFLNYLGLLPGATDNKYLLLGLGLVLGGIVTSTQFH